MSKIVTFGEIMLRLSPPEFLRFSQASHFDIEFGGGESNVAISLSKFGLSTEFITRLPNNDIGDCAKMELRKHGVGVDKIVYGGERLGIYFLETGAISRGSKVVYDRAHSSMATIQPGMIDWEKALDGVTWFHWTGITPAISQSAADVCLEALKVASAKGITISTDFNYRAKLWNYCDENLRKNIMTELSSYCNIILCNQEDAAVFFGIHPAKSATETNRENDILSVIEQLFKKFPNARKIATTLRTSISASHNTWSAILCDRENTYKTKTHQLNPIVDRVGGGDSFMAGLIYGLNTYTDDYQKAVDFAVAASCLKHSIKGDVNLVSVEEVTKLMEGDSSGKVAR
ncbi:sugar kinase [Polaribacter gangjinensis]|uniref:2-dehydro-3-deoxygluconokinase n=1 Tax=Polaribacter gangjinensis TaxID=574710 RepID=A0A2S7WCC9_9FLAO|nr:sugar kinase [Polaribacter gangjinensis]PQJ75280.1 2-dehydro-3-deoxygluconokinase [Polaribacter gangjinensis]